MLDVETLPSEHRLPATKRQPIPTLSDEQQRVFDALKRFALRNAGAHCDDYKTLGGLAGTGKTTVLAALAEELTGPGAPHVVFTAFTGKAVDVLKRKLAAYGVKAPVMTLHALMYQPVTNKQGVVEKWQRRHELGAWIEDGDRWRIDPYDLVIVDEASMLSADLWSDLRSYSVPIIAVGDHGQLPPVGGDALNLMQDPELRLETIHRQAADNPIIGLAHAVREHGASACFKVKNGSDARIQRLPSFNDQAVNIVAHGELAAVGICYKNATRVRLNHLVHERVIALHGEENACDIVICLRNFERTIFNGMRGVLRSIDSDPDSFNRAWMTIDFPENDMRVRAHAQIGQFGRANGIQLADVPGAKRWSDIGLLFDYGYVVTCHKSQGSQWDHVVVQYETTQKDTEETRRRWLYTAITRASERLSIIV